MMSEIINVEINHFGLFCLFVLSVNERCLYHKYGVYFILYKIILIYIIIYII